MPSSTISLETVSAFRALVRKKTAVDALEQLGLNNKQNVGYAYAATLATSTTATTPVKQQTLQQQQQSAAAGAAGKRAEFPQHLVPTPRSQRRVQRSRRRTLPVTAEELNSVPENMMLVISAGGAKVCLGLVLCCFFPGSRIFKCARFNVRGKKYSDGFNSAKVSYPGVKFTLAQICTGSVIL